MRPNQARLQADRLDRDADARSYAAELVRALKEPHTVLLHGIFTAYEDTRQRYPDCKAPAVGLKVEFRKFLDAVLIDFGLGPTGDKIIEGELSGPGMIGEGELRGAWRRWLKARAV